MAIDDAFVRSKSVSPGAPVDTWFCNADGGVFQIIVENLGPTSSGVEVRAVFDLPDAPDVVLTTLSSSGRFPSGPHILAARSRTQIQLNALPADQGQTTCDVDYSVKWLK